MLEDVLVPAFQFCSGLFRLAIVLVLYLDVQATGDFGEFGITHGPADAFEVM